MTQHISAITLLVPTYKEGLAFYVDKLGFDLLEDTKLSDTKRWIRVSPSVGGPASAGSIDPGDRLKPEEAPAGAGAQTALLLAEPKNDQERAALGNQTGGRVSFFLETDDFARDHAALRAKGVDFKEAPRFEPYGTVAVFTDPWGNLWDLIEPKT